MSENFSQSGSQMKMTRTLETLLSERTDLHGALIELLHRTRHDVTNTTNRSLDFPFTDTALIPTYILERIVQNRACTQVALMNCGLRSEFCKDFLSSILEFSKDSMQ